MKCALITGITGQDGSYLAELLLSKGYEVHGIIRRASTFNTSRIDHIYQDPNQPSARLFLHHGDVSSTEWILNLIYSLAPDELYHLAAQSHVRVSFDIPEYTRLPAYTSIGQMLGLVTGIKKGFNPDQPRNLSRVVMLAEQSVKPEHAAI